jgi:hypothetical protein
MSMNQILGQLIGAAAVRLFSIGAAVAVALFVGDYVTEVFAAVESPLASALAGAR